MYFVDGPDGVGKTGYSKWISHETGIPRVEMRPVHDTDAIEEKSKVFNALLRDLHDQDVELIVDRGSVSSIVYSEIFDRGVPEHAWDTLESVGPMILYLRCDAEELAIRYGNNDEIFTAEEVRTIANTYDSVMSKVDEQTPAEVVTIDTSTDAVQEVKEHVFRAIHGGN